MSAVLIVLALVCGFAAGGKAAHITLDEDGVLRIDGRKILPIGFTGGPPPDGVTPEGKPAFAEIRAAGGTFFRTGQQASSSWNEDTTAQEQIMMDAAARYGLYCWPRLGKLSSLEEGDGKKELLLRSVLNRFRNHPGLLLWKNVDQPQWGKVPAESMIRAYRVIKEVDPCHPVGLTQAPRGTVADLRPYNAAADILLLDIYPVGYPPGLHSQLPIKLTGASDVEFCVREVVGDVYILACKREGKTVQVKFTGLPAWAAEGEVLYESPRKVQAKAGQFTDWFAPFDVHVYHFRHQEAGTASPR